MNRFLSAAVGGPPRHGVESRERGQSIVELAFVAPIVFLILGVSADVGRLFVSQVSIINAAREAARYGATASYDSAGIQQRVYDEMGPATLITDPQQITAISVVKSSAPNPSTGNQVKVTVSYRFTLITPIPVGWQTLTLTGIGTHLVF